VAAAAAAAAEAAEEDVLVGKAVAGFRDEPARCDVEGRVFDLDARVASSMALATASLSIAAFWLM
jgi:hypothetical protein